MITQRLKATGRLGIQLRDGHGRLKKELTTTNLVVNSGLHHIADQLSDRGEAAMSHLAVGTGTTPPAAADTQLGNQIEDRHAFTSKTQGGGSGANKVTYTAEWAAGHATGALTEAGIFNSDSAGQMLCRAVFAVINKGASDTMTLNWELTLN
jgi:hypothetical protein